MVETQLEEYVRRCRAIVNRYDSNNFNGAQIALADLHVDLDKY